MTRHVMQAQDWQTIVSPDDTASLNYGPTSDGQTFCGNREITFNPELTNYDFVEFNSVSSELSV
jgi:hypothetical protein